ncbi:hypothetical protein [Ligilactobacillus aviarius]|uniref:hypothetical protein n=1 Tax=Ligilactobacillus aviarius TaxID=1606 RepID=UPI0024BA28CB|nr:hypothetical protein [Ligilactobacillus aviarius]
MTHDDEILELRNEKIKLEDEEDSLKSNLKKVDDLIENYHQNCIKRGINIDDEIEGIKQSKYYRQIGENLVEIQRNKKMIAHRLEELKNNLSQSLKNNKKKQEKWIEEYKRKLSDEND